MILEWSGSPRQVTGYAIPAMLNEENNVIAIVPMKRLSDGKSRLARSLTSEQRAELTLGMLRRVLVALTGASIDLVWVVGGDQRVRNVAPQPRRCLVGRYGPQPERHAGQGL